MPMEAETITMLFWGFNIVIAISLVLIIKLWIETKEKSYIWFIVQLCFLYFCFITVIYTIKIKPAIPQAMLSEENSLALGISGILWAVSMFCMLIGIWKLTKKFKK